MKKIKTFLPLVFSYYLFINSSNIYAEYKKAIVIVPVADLVGQEIGQLVNKKKIQQAYEQIPISLDQSDCLRIHQLLFNEVVEVLEEKEQEVFIQIPHLFYLRPPSNEPQVSYWTLKKNIITFDKIKHYTNDLTKIPSPLSFKNKNNQLNKKNIVTLAEPWFDLATKQTFSAGTRFVYAKSKKRETTVYLFNPKTNRHEIKTIPNNKLAMHMQQNSEQRRKNFIKLVRRWARRDEGFIPYVLGGFSFTNTAKASFSNMIYNTITKKTTTCFVRNDIRSTPKTGFDCAGIIARAAQICDIPFFYKNTTTIRQCLPPITKQTNLMQGDIIWFPGHVMVVADLAKQTLIEAHGYNNGYGKVHEIELKKLFKGINTYKDLLHAYYNKQPIIYLDSNGNRRRAITDFTLLRLIN